MNPLSLAEVASEPERLDALQPEELVELLGELERFKARVWVQLNKPLEVHGAEEEALAQDDRMLTVEEAADVLGVDSRWLYDRSDELPFAKKLAPRPLRFSERGLYRWLKTRP